MESSDKNNVNCSGIRAHGNESFQVAKFDFNHVKTPFLISVSILIASLAKLFFHLYARLPSLLPESCLLIGLGVVIGGILFSAGAGSGLFFTPSLFFLFLLPPIVFESGYFLRNRDFFRNLGTILVFAVIGTLWNTFAVGICIYAVCSWGWVDVDIPLTKTEAFLFASIVCAVDPVAVLAVFEEIHVNELLHILVFGESILNDAVVIVLYRMFEAFSGQETVTGNHIGAGVGSFFVVSLGGLGTGIVFGILTALLTRFTDHVRVIEPIAVLAMGYLAYLFAEMFRLSGIVCLIFSAIVMKHYVDANVSRKSRTTIKYSLKMASSISETIIFIFLGIEVVNDESHNWNTGFVGFTIFFILVIRFVGVFSLSWLVNRFRNKRLLKVDQFITAYGGLRGAVSFSLALVILHENKLPSCTAKMMFTTTVAVIFFTSFILGITVKPLVKVMHVKQLEQHKLSVGEQIADRVIEHSVAGIQEIIGSYGFHYLWEIFEYIDINYLQVWLEREPTPPEHEIIDAFVRARYQALNADVQHMQQAMHCGQIGRRRGSRSLLAEAGVAVVCPVAAVHRSPSSIPARYSSLLRRSLTRQPSREMQVCSELILKSVSESEDDLDPRQHQPPLKVSSSPAVMTNTDEVDRTELRNLLQSQPIHPHNRHARHTIYEAEDDDDELAFELKRNQGVLKFIQKNSNTPTLAKFIYTATGTLGSNAFGSSLFQPALWTAGNTAASDGIDEYETTV